MAGTTNPSQQQFKELAELRLEEAKILYEQGFYDGATYICGYSIEFALKAVICKLLDLDTYLAYSDFKVHDIKKLVVLAGIEKKWIIAKADTVFGSYIDLVLDWSESTRYRPKNTATKNNTIKLLNAIANPTQTVPNSYFITPLAPETNPPSIGVLTWIQQNHW